MQAETEGSRVAILTLGKIDMKAKIVTGDKQGHYIKIKVSIHQEDIIIISTYHPALEHQNI